MSKKGLRIFIIGTALAVFLVASPARGESVSGPVVYADQYITVRSMILNFEEETFHLGDVISLQIALKFDAGRVRVINLDETLLRNSWRDTKWIAHYGEPRIIRSGGNDDQTQLVAAYDFQIVGCPDPAFQCPGGKAYQLEDISLGIELIDNDSRVVSTADITFRPSPTYVGLSSALPLFNGRLESFNIYFPSRAFGLPIPVSINPYPSLLLFLIGLVGLVAISVAPTARAWVRHRAPAGIGIIGKRWEHVLDRLQGQTLEDDEFREGVRLAITWFCYDEFEIDPTRWSVDDSAPTGDEVLEQLKSIYREAMQGSEVSDKQRRETLALLTDILKRI
jgi:hypothetical protein